MERELLENIFDTAFLVFLLGFIVPQMMDDPPFWVKALFMVPLITSIPVIAISAIIMIWS